MANDVFDIFFLELTKIRNWIFPIIVVIVICIYNTKDRKKACVVLGLAILTICITDPLCAHILKPLFCRLRPSHPSYFKDGEHLFLTGGRFLAGISAGMSLPSAHAVNVFAQAMHLALWYPGKRVWFFAVASLVGLSRIYVGVHYPSDIAFGALLGLAIGASVYFSFIAWRRTPTQNKES